MKTLLALLAALMICHTASPAELFGTIDAISGNAFVSDKSGKSTGISVGQKIYEGQTIATASDSEVHLVTEDGGIIALRPSTTFRVDGYRAKGDSADKIFMSLFRGAMRSITGWVGKHNTSAYLISTPNATIGIRGTDHETTVIEETDGDEAGTYDTVNEGATLLKTRQGETEVSPGKFAFVPKNRAIAPSLLSRQPNFWARRRLKIEARIQQRKEFFRGRIEHMREQRIKQLKSVRKQQPHVSDRHVGVRERKHGQAMEMRHELRGHPLERSTQRREGRIREVEGRRRKIGEQSRLQDENK